MDLRNQAGCEEIRDERRKNTYYSWKWKKWKTKKEKIMEKFGKGRKIEVG